MVHAAVAAVLQLVCLSPVGALALSSRPDHETVVEVPRALLRFAPRDT
jgi:hypothetical protein